MRLVADAMLSIEDNVSGHDGENVLAEIALSRASWDFSDRLAALASNDRKYTSAMCRVWSSLLIPRIRQGERSHRPICGDQTSMKRDL